MTETTNENLKNEEIDLLGLIRSIGKFILKIISALGKSVLVSIIFLLKNWIPLSVSLLLGGAISVGLKYTIPPKFSSDMVLRTNVIPAEEMITFINRLYSYQSEDNYAATASALALSEKSVANIEDILASWIIDRNHDRTPDYVDYLNNHNIYDTTDIRMTDRFNIRVRTKEPQDLEKVKNGIIKYINSDSLFVQRNRVRNQQNEVLLKRADYDIIQLDSLQKVKYFEETRNRIPEKGGQLVFLQQQNTQLVYDDIYKLYIRRQDYEQQLFLYKDIVTTISDFSVPIKPYTRIRYYAYVIIPLFFGLTIILIIIRKNKESIKHLLNRY
jgi:hypothetical protein